MALVLKQFIHLLLWSKTFDIDIYEDSECARAWMCATHCADKAMWDLMHNTLCTILSCVYSSDGVQCMHDSCMHWQTSLWQLMCQINLLTFLQFGSKGWNRPWFWMITIFTYNSIYGSSKKMHHHGFTMVHTWFSTGWSQRSDTTPKMLVWWVKIYFILAYLSRK